MLNESTAGENKKTTRTIYVKTPTSQPAIFLDRLYQITLFPSPGKEICYIRSKINIVIIIITNKNFKT